MHLLYEIARAKSIGILRGGAPAPAKAKPVVRVPQQPAVSGDQAQLAAQLEEMKMQLDAAQTREGEMAKHAREMDSQVKSLRDEIELRLQLREPSREDPSSPLVPPAAMVDRFASAMPPNPFAGAALTEDDEMRARQLFHIALAKQRKGWGLHEVHTEIDRATFIELIQKLATAESEEAEAQQQPPSPPSTESIGAVFDRADADGSSTVSETEFLRLFLEIKTGQAPNFLGSKLFGNDGSFNFRLDNWASGFVDIAGKD